MSDINHNGNSKIRRFVRDGLVWVAASGAILGGAVWFSVPAHADLIDRAICAVLDDYPTPGGVYGVILGLQQQGYSAYDAGAKVGVAIRDTCPEHTPEALEFARIATGEGMAV